MHEASLCMELVQVLEDQAREQSFRRVQTVWLEIGKHQSVEPDAMRFAFDATTKGTVAEGAKLIVEEKAARAWCFGCSKEVALEGESALCPSCGSAETHVVGGQELRIRQIEVE